MADKRPLLRYTVNLLVERSGSAPIGRGPNVCVAKPTWATVARPRGARSSAHCSRIYTMITPRALCIEPTAGICFSMPIACSRSRLHGVRFKRTLYAGEIRIESLGELLSLMSTVSLDPEPIALERQSDPDRRALYLLLAMRARPRLRRALQGRRGFREHFERTPANSQLYARLVATLSRPGEAAAVEPGRRRAHRRATGHDSSAMLKG